MLAFFTALFGAFGFLGAVENIMNTMMAAWLAYQKSKQDAAINQVQQTTLPEAQSQDDFVKAAEEEQKIQENQ